MNSTGQARLPAPFAAVAARPLISTTDIFGAKPAWRAAALSACPIAAPAASPTAPQFSQIETPPTPRLVTVIDAAQEGVAAGYPVHETLRHQKIERAVDGDRRQGADVRSVP